jgi:beta-lactamase superfamily II metal-dependent hydrolase
MTVAVCDGLLQIADVEHGACALMTIPEALGARRLMIDCGHNSTTGLTPGLHLARLGVRYLDQLVITNLDEDHVSGYPSFAQQGVSIGWQLFNPSVRGADIAALKSETGMGTGMNSLVTGLGRRTALTPVQSNNLATALPGVELEWFWHKYPHFDDENNLSLVLLVKYRGVWFLFPGDMEQAGFKHMLESNARFRTIVPLVDILIASHHGRESGLYKPMFEQYGCSPKLTVISDDAKQHETQETTTYYGSKTQGIWFSGAFGRNLRKVLTTRSDGEIRFTFRNGDCFPEYTGR